MLWMLIAVIMILLKVFQIFPINVIYLELENKEFKSSVFFLSY
jgi:hypothetical protein